MSDRTEQAKEDYKKMAKALKSGMSLSQAESEFKIPKWRYYHLRKRFDKNRAVIPRKKTKLTITEMPIPHSTIKVVAFYGEPEAVAETVRRLS